jgi:hypothetical protein
MKRIIGTLALAGLLPLLALTGCGSVVNDYCDRQVTCLGGNPADHAACIDSLAGSEKAAKDYGCVEAFDNYIACRSGGTCNGGQFQTSCDAQSKAYDSCISAASAIR